MQVSGNRNNLLVAAATGQMMVYSHKRLVWAAKGDTCPVAVRVATFAGLQGTRKLWTYIPNYDQQKQSGLTVNRAISFFDNAPLGVQCRHDEAVSTQHEYGI